MPKLSLTKIFAAIIGIIVLLHVNDILEVIGQIYEWLARSLRFMRNFPQDAQATIAFCSILLVVVLIFKAVNK